jgi:hypothetical protein
MAEAKYELEQFLSKLGISSKSLQRIRFGGVVGKQALVAVFVAIGLAIVARQTADPSVHRLCIYGLLLDAFLAIVAIGLHGHNHPFEATLEGAEVVAYRHVQQEFAMKGQKEIGPAAPVLEGLGHKPISASSVAGKELQAPNPTSKGELV